MTFDLVAAIADAKPGATIAIPRGVTLRAPLVIAKRVTLAGGRIRGAAKKKAIVEIRAAVTLRDVAIERTGGIGDVILVGKAGVLTATRVTIRGGRDPKGDVGAGLRLIANGRAELVEVAISACYDGVIATNTSRMIARDCSVTKCKNCGIGGIKKSRVDVEETTFANNALCGLLFGDDATGDVKATRCDGSQYGVVVQDRAKPRIEGVAIKRSKIHGMIVQGRSKPMIVECVVETSTDQGIFVRGDAAPTIERCESRANKRCGINVAGPAAPVIRGCHVHGNRNAGIVLDGTSTARVESTRCEDNAVCGLSIQNRARPIVIDSSFTGNRDSGIIVTDRGDARIEDCLAAHNKFDGITLLESGRARIVRARCDRNAHSGIEVHDDASATLEACTVSGNAEYGIALFADGELSVTDCSGERNADGDLYLDEEVDESALELRDNTFRKSETGRYYVRVRPGLPVPKLLSDFATFVGGRRRGELGYFELAIEPLDVSYGYPDHRDALAKALSFIHLGEGSELALLLDQTPSPVVMIGSEGELRTVANSLGEFLQLLAVRRTRVGDLDEQPHGKRVAFAAWLKQQRIGKRSAKRFDFAAYLAARPNRSVSDAQRDAALSRALARAEPIVAADRQMKFRKPGAASHVKAIAKALGLAAPPPDLVRWFAWRDGQSGYHGLHPEENWTALSASGALGTWEYLNEPGADLRPPARATLLPLFENGGGDHGMYEVAEGKSRGALFTYYHDDKPPKNPTHPSLAAWVTHCLDARDAWVDEPRGDVELVWKKTKYTKVKPPSYLELDDAPIGTTYYRHEYLTMYDGPAVYAFVKITEDAWAHDVAKTIAEAMETIATTIADEPVRTWSYDARYIAKTLARRDRALDAFSPVPIPEDLYRGVVRVHSVQDE